MKLISLPAFVDNYIWMLHDGREAWVVDPGDAAPVIEAIRSHGLTLGGILVTHHHGDHVGGIEALRTHLEGEVVGPAAESIPEPFRPVAGGDCVQVLGLSFQVIDVPGHTSGHIAFYASRPGPVETTDGLLRGPLLFCGDTLFSGGCGRLFEGTAAQMHASLSALAALDPSTAVCCAHEYTLSNLRFARTVEPRNLRLAEYTAWCEGRRAAGLPTLPSRIGLEREINPFLRCDDPDVAAAARSMQPGARSPVQVLASLRQWKNDFR